MHLSAIARLRLAFLALGVLVFAPLAWLLDSVEARLDAQRRLRHEVVADRIFDELERELTSVLAQGSLQARLPPGQRPPVESWPPFVIGYVQRSNNGNQLFTRNASGPADTARLRLAVDGILLKVGPVARPAIPPGILGSAAPGAAPALPSPLLGPPPSGVRPVSRLEAPPLAPVRKIAPGRASQSDVLKNLNRANEQREQDLNSYR